MPPAPASGNVAVGRRVVRCKRFLCAVRVGVTGMRTGAADGHRGYFHEAGFYGSDDEFLDLVVPFVEGGIAAGEPTLLAFGEPNEKLVRDAMGEPEGLSYLRGSAQYARPAGAIKKYRDLLAEHVAGGAGQ